MIYYYLYSDTKVNYMNTKINFLASDARFPVSSCFNEKRLLIIH